MLASPDKIKPLISFFKRGTRLTYKKGEYVIRPGETPPGVFYIESGMVKAFDITKYGEENLLIIRRDGEIIALTWAITGEDRNIIYQTLSPTVMWRVPRENFIYFVRHHPVVALPLVDMVTNMYRRHSERIFTLEYRTVRERLISYLIVMAKRFGKETEEGVMIDVPLRHQDIASSINSSRETTSREMSYLEHRGLVKSKQLLITIKDMEALNSYL